MKVPERLKRYLQEWFKGWEISITMLDRLGVILLWAKRTLSEDFIEMY